MRGKSFDPATSEDWSGSTTLLTDAGGFSILACEKVSGSNELVIATRSAGNAIVVRRYDADGVLQVPSGGQYSTIAGNNAQYIAVEASSTANSVNVATVDGTTLKVYSWNLSTGAAIGGANTPAEVAAETCANVAMVRSTSTHVEVLASVSTIGTPDVARVMRWTYTHATGSFATGNAVIGTKLTAGAVYLSENDSVVFGAVDDGLDTTPNMLLEQVGSGQDRVAPVAVKDLGFASPPISGITPKLAADTSQTPTRYYWAHGVESADGASIPIVCELMLTDPKRRQIARVGRGVAIAGALPCWYDGAQLVELGFGQRPRIVSLAAANSTGELQGGATYSYRAHHSWFDTLGRLHRSSVALPVDVTLAATDDTVTAVVSGPLTGRHNRGSAPLGSVVRTELYRTRAIVTETFPLIVSTQPLDPPQSPLNGLTLALYYHDGTSGTFFNVPFDAGSTTLAAIVVDINTVTSGSVVAAGDGGFLSLTGVDAGEGVQLFIAGGNALEILGFEQNDSSFGTTEIERGDVFHLTNVAYTTISGACGDRVTIVDVRDDAADSDGISSQAVLYTQLESPLDDHSPLPSDRVWAGPERLEVAGHPRRETWTSSQLVDQQHPPSFASEGTPGFSGSLVESIEAVISQDSTKLYLTRKGVWQVEGQGPQVNGQGKFFAARRIFSDGGLVDEGWRSLLECSLGTWFQLGSDKLYLAPPGGVPVWLGFPVRELLRSFPVIVAACLTGNSQTAAFALQNTAGDDGRILLFDLRKRVWFVDDSGDTPIALADYQGRLCYANTTGTVYMADAAAGSGAFVPLTLQTAHSLLFGAAGQGEFPHVMLVGELLGVCTLELQADYDDGAGFVSAGTFALTGTAGRTVRQEFDIAEVNASQLALKLLVTGGSGSAGLALVALEVYSERDPGPALLGDTYRR